MGGQPVRLYIGGSSSDLARIRRWMAEVQKFTASETAIAMAPGIELTHNWIASIEKVGAPNPRAASPLDRAAWAAEDLEGVREADLLWILMPPGMSDGAMWEAGYADALGMDIFISGPDTERSIFTARARCFETDEQAFNCLVDTYYHTLDEDTVPEHRYSEP